MVSKAPENQSISNIYKGIEPSSKDYNFPVLRKNSNEEQEKFEKKNNERSLNTNTRKEDERSQASGKKNG